MMFKIQNYSIAFCLRNLPKLAVLLFIGFVISACSPAKYEENPSTDNDQVGAKDVFDGIWRFSLNWGGCDVACGGGTEMRDVFCEDSEGRQVPTSRCKPADRPPSTRTCNVQACPARYVYTAQAYDDCVDGTQTRVVDCYDNDTRDFVDESLCTGTKPATSQSCTLVDFVTYTEQVPATQNQVDLLMVIDDSGSMEDDLTKLGNAMGGFVGDLSAAGLNWQMCFTTTDVYTYSGDALNWTRNPNSTKPWLLESTASGLETVFQLTIADQVQLIRNNGPGNNDEQGIYATHLALKNDSVVQTILNPDDQQDLIGRNGPRCFRRDAALSVILLSDEDERSVGRKSSQHFNLQPHNEARNLRPTVDEVFPPNPNRKRFVFNSIIIRPTDTNCKALQNQEAPAYEGWEYAEASNLTGGYIGNICATNYRENLRYFQDAIATSLNQATLACTPSGDVEVLVTPTPQQLNFTLNANVISFDPVLPGGSRLVVNYACPKGEVARAVASVGEPRASEPNGFFSKLMSIVKNLWHQLVAATVW